MQFDKDICVEAHISDLHFGAFDPEKQYNILKKQFINKIKNIFIWFSFNLII